MGKRGRFFGKWHDHNDLSPGGPNLHLPFPVLLASAPPLMEADNLFKKHIHLDLLGNAFQAKKVTGSI